MEGPYCTGCSDLIDEGSVIAFGDSLFHLKCFICAKCSEQVDCESNLLLLTNGRPVCESCSYCCSACKQVIRDEAIMTGDEAYHANCFRCVSCKKKIDDLVFTQTSKGIHCTPCYEKRRSQKKRRREEREKKQLHRQCLNLKEPQSMPVQVPASSTSKQLKIKSKNNNNNNPVPSTSHSKLLEKQVAKSGKTRLVGERVSPKMTKINTANPLTPSRSRSNSVEIPSKMRLNDNRPTPSRSEVIKTPSSPPSSISSVSPTPVSSQSASSSRHTPPSLTKSTSTTSLHNSVSNQSIDFSFFDNDSTDISHVSNKMNSNVTLNNNDNNTNDDKKEVPEIVKTTENIARASQYLEYSLVSEDYLDGLSNATEGIGQSSDTQLRADLAVANSKIQTLQTNYNKMKDASRKALEELMRAKEEFSKEVGLRQQHEYMILQLQHQLQVVFHGRTMSRIELSVITKDEIERVARIKSELDKTCGELQGYRDSLAKDIESLAKQKQAGLEINATSHLEEQQKAIAAEIKSLTNDRDHLRTETADLEKIKVSALQDITTMGIKNTEKTQIDIELARCFTEKELTSNLPPGTSFLYSPSPSISSELQSPGRKSVDTGIVRKITARDSYHASQPKIFKLKNKPGNMFAKLSGKSNNKIDAMTMYGGTSVSSMNLTGEATKRSKVSHDGSGIQHGAHTFQHTSFLRPTKCDSCSEKMWGLSELRCNACLYVSHGRCLSNVPLICSGGGRSNSSSSFDLSSTETEPSNKSSLFGTDISARASTEERSIPVIVEQCINAVQKRGMDYEGIYRKSGGAAQIRLIHQAFDNGEPIDLKQDYPINDIGAITSVLKQYLRELPDPLLTYSLYPTLIDVISSVPDQEKSSKFIELLSQLPKVNFDTLKLLLQHLYKIQERSTENLMTTKNLAMVFGPTLLRDIESTRDLIDMSSKNSVIEYLIIHVNELFD